MTRFDSINDITGWFARLGRWLSNLEAAMDITETSLLENRIQLLEHELVSIRLQIRLMADDATEQNL